MQRYAAGKFVSKSLTTGVSRCRQISRIAGQIVNRIYNLYPNFTTFEEIKQALSSIIRDIRTGRGIRQEERLTEWMDNQEACIMMDISPRKLLTLRSTGKIPYSRIDRKIYYRKKDIITYMEGLLQKGNN